MDPVYCAVCVIIVRDSKAYIIAVRPDTAPNPGPYQIKTLAELIEADADGYPIFAVTTRQDRNRMGLYAISFCNGTAVCYWHAVQGDATPNYVQTG